MSFMPGLYLTREYLKQIICSKNTENIAAFIYEWIKNPWGLEMLIDLNIDPKSNHAYNDKGNILHFAAIHGQKEFIEALFRFYHCDPILNKVSENGYTPLMYAEDYGKKEIRDMLVAYGAHINYVSPENSNSTIVKVDNENLKHAYKEYLNVLQKVATAFTHHDEKLIGKCISSGIQDSEHGLTGVVQVNTIYLDEFYSN
jgi:hypothetical protein